MYAISLFFKVGIHWFHRFSVFPVNISSHTLAWITDCKYFAKAIYLDYKYELLYVRWNSTWLSKNNPGVSRIVNENFPQGRLTSTRKGLMSRAIVVITVAKLAIYYFIWVLKTKNKKVNRLVSEINNNHWIFRLKIWA